MMRTPTDTPRSRRPDVGRPCFLIVIDTEGDNLWARPRRNTTGNARYLPRFQTLCEAHGFKPTYVTNYEMAQCPEFRTFGAWVLKRAAGEIGMHLHAWDSPPLVPLTADDVANHPYLTEYPEPVMRDKVAVMTDLLEQTFGRKMVSHRAGRWGFDATYARLLAERGYLVDCSVTPHVSWKRYLGDPAGGGGPDYAGFPDRAYFLDLDDIRRSGRSSLLEVPLSVVRPRSRLVQGLHRKLANAPRLVRGPVNRLWPTLSKLEPNGRNLRAMLRLLGQAVEEHWDYVEFTLHSSELMPGGSPNFPTPDSVERLYDDLAALFGAAARTFKGATLYEYYQEFTARRQSPATEAACLSAVG